MRGWLVLISMKACDMFVPCVPWMIATPTTRVSLVVWFVNRTWIPSKLRAVLYSPPTQDSIYNRVQACPWYTRSQPGYAFMSTWIMDRHALSLFSFFHPFSLSFFLSVPPTRCHFFYLSPLTKWDWNPATGSTWYYPLHDCDTIRVLLCDWHH